MYRAVKTVAADFKQKYLSYQPWVIVLVFLWAALHDRPPRWACRGKNGQTTRLRPARLPSPNTISRRAYKVDTGLFWRAVERHLRQTMAPGLLSFLDGKPLPIPKHSTDPDARRGRGVGGMANG